MRPRPRSYRPDQLLRNCRPTLPDGDAGFEQLRKMRVFPISRSRTAAGVCSRESTPDITRMPRSANGRGALVGTRPAGVRLRGVGEAEINAGNEVPDDELPRLRGRLPADPDTSESPAQNYFAKCTRRDCFWSCPRSFEGIRSSVTTAVNALIGATTARPLLPNLVWSASR